jgi:hypothetical protein
MELLVLGFTEWLSQSIHETHKAMAVLQRWPLSNHGKGDNAISEPCSKA